MKNVSRLKPRKPHPRTRADHSDRGENYQRLFEELTDGVYVTNVDGTVIDANQAFLDMLGYSKQEFLKLNIVKVYANPHDRPVFRDKIESQGFVKNHPVKLRKKNGTAIDCLITANVRKASGKIIGYRGVVRDVTEYKDIQRQIIRNQKRESIGTLLGGIAHDFNNLFQVVLGYSEFTMLNESLDEKARNNLKIIYHAAESGADVVKRLLTFIQQNPDSEAVPMDLNKHIFGLERFFVKTLPPHIIIELDLSPELKMIHADPSQIDQVVVNIVVNAKEAMPEGGTITIQTKNVRIDDTRCKTCRRKMTPGDYVQLTVSDTGIGIGEKVISRIFEPYFTTKQMDSNRGTGLGLSVAQGIIRSYQGHIDCKSEVGAGTSFKILVPALENSLGERSNLVELAKRMPSS